MILLPLVSENGKFDRVIGSLAQLSHGFQGNNKHIIGMSLTAIRHLDKDTIPVDFNALGSAVAIKPGGKIAEDAKQIGHLFVIEGGVKN